MLPAGFRIGIKIFSLIFCIVFVFFYVLLGLRYNPNLNKIETNNLYINFNFFTKNNSIFFQHKKYFSSNGNLVIYNQNQGCYELEYEEKKKKICGKNGVVLNQNIVKLVSIKSTQKFFCQDSEGIEFVQNFGENILHFQRYKKIDFLFTIDNIYSCNGKNDCELLTSYSGNLVCFTKKGVIINQNDVNYLYELK